MATKNLLIIGASHGIGRAIADTQGAHYALYTTSRSACPALPQHREWNVAEPFPAEFLPDALHGLVYCPGSLRLQPFSRISDAAFREDWEINFLGAVKAIQAAIPALEQIRGASIVLFSTVAVGTGMPMHANVASAKGAVEGLTRALAAEFAPQIRVNAIAPSLTDTPLAGQLLRSAKQRERLAMRHPLETLGCPEEIAAAAGFLLSEDAHWITGQVLAVDGGIGALRKFT